MTVESQAPSQNGDEDAAPAAGQNAATAQSAARRGRVSAEDSELSALVRRPWTAWAGKTLLKSSSHCPLPVLHTLAAGVARVGSWLPTRETTVTRTNVALCFPELSPGEQARFVRRSLTQAACMAAELGHVWMRPVPEVLARMVEVRGEEHLERALKRGRGIIFAGPHLGAWELAGLWLGTRFPVTTLYRAPRVRELESIYLDARRRGGAKLFPTDASGVRAIFQALGKGETVAILPDQDPGRGGGVFVPFFGIPANTSTLLPRFASRNKASVLITFAERLPRGAGYRMHLHPGSEEISSGDLESGARALSADIETCVRMAPEQYLWSYKRFKFRPPGEPDLYPRR